VPGGRPRYNVPVRDPVTLRAWVGRALLGCAVLTLVQPSLAQNHTQQRVLALYVTTPGAAGAASFEAVYQKTFGTALEGRVDFHSEFIDVARFSMPGYTAALGDFFRYKYKQLPPDVVIATTEGSRQFVERFRADLFPGIPVVFVDRATSSPPGPGMTGVKADLDLAGTLDLALTLQPETTQVFVVGGVSEFDRFYERLARQQLQRFEGRVALTYLFDQALGDLEETVAQLPPKSVIYYLTLGEDAAGARFRSIDALDHLAAVASVPIYAWNGVAMNHGVVGGRLYSNEVVAERTAELALRILRGEKPEGIPVLGIDPNLTQLDWRQLREIRIDEAPAPQGTTILFREPGLWERYKVYIAGALGLMFLQSAFIAGLLFQRTQRRRMEAALRESEARFRVMADTAPVMIWLAGRDKRYDFFNQRWLDFRGRTLEEEAGDGWTEGIHPDDAVRCWQTYVEAFDARTSFHREYRFRRSDGEYCWLRDTGVPRVAQDGSFAGYIGSCIEITDIKRAEREMRENQATLQASNTQISELFGRLIAAQETERTRIARDLHDDVSQRVAGLSIMISRLRRRFGGQPDESDVMLELASMQRNTTALADEIRNVSRDLHPSLLQHTGLDSALSVFCAQFQTLQAIAVTYSGETDLGPVEAETALCLYRIAQEALHNVAKHADARHVGVTLSRTANGVQLSIADDGKGFDFMATRGKGPGLGLVSMDERVRLLQGRVHIDSQPRGGTRVLVEIPQLHELSPDREASPAGATLLNEPR